MLGAVRVPHQTRDAQHLSRRKGRGRSPEENFRLHIELRALVIGVSQSEPDVESAQAVQAAIRAPAAGFVVPGAEGLVEVPARFCQRRRIDRGRSRGRWSGGLEIEVGSNARQIEGLGWWQGAAAGWRRHGGNGEEQEKETE